VVVGGGAIGLATACELARKGCSVAVVDAGQVRPPTTLTSFARLNAAEKTLRAYFDLNAAGLAAFHRLAEQDGMPPWLHLTGHLEWASTDERRRELRERTRLVETFGYRVDVLSGSDVTASLEPDLVVADDAEVSFFPDEGYAETTGLLHHLEQTARGHGVELRRGQCTAISTTGGRACGVELRTGDVLAADVVVCAAGRWSSELAGAAAPLLRPEDEGVTGFLATTAPASASLTRSVFAPGLNVRPDTGGRLVLQAFDLDGDAASALTEGVPAHVRGEFARRLGETLRLPSPVEVEDVLAGVRALPVDGLPIVGWADGLDNLYVVVSHSGVTLCLILGGLAASEIIGDAGESLLEPFRPGRFAQSEPVPAP